MTTDELLKALIQKYPDGVPLNPKAVRLLRSDFSFEDHQIDELKDKMFQLEDGLWFTIDMISDEKPRLDLIDFAKKWLSEYGHFSVECLFHTYGFGLLHIDTPADCAAYLRHLGFKVSEYKNALLCIKPDQKTWTELETEFAIKLSRLWLGKKLSADIVDYETHAIIIPSRRRITMKMLYRLAKLHEHAGSRSEQVDEAMNWVIEQCEPTPKIRIILPVNTIRSFDLIEKQIFTAGMLPFSVICKMMPHLSCEALNILREDYLEDVHVAQIGGELCWCVAKVIPLPKDFSEKVTSAVDTLKTLGEALNATNISFALNMIYGFRFREEIGLLHSTSFMHICGKYYRGKSVRWDLTESSDDHDRFESELRRIPRIPSTDHTGMPTQCGVSWSTAERCSH